MTTLWELADYTPVPDVSDTIFGAQGIVLGQDIYSDFEKDTDTGWSFYSDTDVYAVDLVAGGEYQFTLKGMFTADYAQEGLGAQDFSLELLAPTTEAVAYGQDVDEWVLWEYKGGTTAGHWATSYLYSQDQVINFSPTTTGTYYLEADGGGSYYSVEQATYKLETEVISEPEPVPVNQYLCDLTGDPYYCGYETPVEPEPEPESGGDVYNNYGDGDINIYNGDVTIYETTNTTIYVEGDYYADSVAIVNDSLIGNEWTNTIFAYQGADSVDGEGGDDSLYGNQGDDTLTGGYGQDVLYGGQDQDQIYGNHDNDLIYGHKGDDVVYAGKDNDQVYGNEGTDYLFGNVGNDWIWAGKDDDWVDGGDGDDHLWGNKGADLFHLSAGYDVIYDFSADDGDRLEVSSYSSLSYQQIGSDLLVTHDEGSALLTNTWFGLHYEESTSVVLI